MSPRFRILVILASLLLLAITLELVRRGKLREKYSLIFLFGSGITLLLAIFAGTLDRLAAALGIGYGPSLAFCIAAWVLAVVQVVQGVFISAFSMHSRDLAQKIAGLEWQIEQLGQRVYEAEEKSHLAWPPMIQEEATGVYPERQHEGEL